MSDEREIWLPVIGLPLGHYSVSNLGRIKSHARNFPRRGNGGSYFLHERIMLTPIDPQTGYPCVTLNVYGFTLRRKVHKIVADTFLGPPMPGYQVRHKNSDPLDNRLENLEVRTPRRNSADQKEQDTDYLCLGEKHPFAKLSDAEVEEIRCSDARADDLADWFGVSIGHIYSIQRGDTRKAPSISVINEDVVLDIRYSREPVSVVAAKYGLPHKVAYRIRTGETWGHIQPITDPCPIEDMYQSTRGAA
jgi:hypothetical protein